MSILHSQERRAYLLLYIKRRPLVRAAVIFCLLTSRRVTSVFISSLDVPPSRRQPLPASLPPGGQDADSYS